MAIGGYAVAYHGYVRYTGDLDLFVQLSANNAAKLVSALREFGFDLPQLKPALFLRKGRTAYNGRLKRGKASQSHTLANGPVSLFTYDTFR